MLRSLTVKTRQQVEFVDVTGAIQEEITAANVTQGACILYVPHTTAGLLINENADPDVIRDIRDALEKAAPSNGHYLHREGNAHAHIKSSLLGCSVCLMIEGGRLTLGTWQGIFFCEFEAPANGVYYCSSYRMLSRSRRMNDQKTEVGFKWMSSRVRGLSIRAT